MKDMKKIYTYFACALLALGAVSCAKDGLRMPEKENDGMTLRFSLGNPTTKAEGDRLSVGNEDRVNKIDYFFYKVVDGTISTDTAPLIAKRTLTPENKLAFDYELKLTSADLKLLYPNPDDQVAIYAVANLPGSVVLPEGKTFDTITLAELKAIEVRSTFAGTDRWPHPLKVTDNDLSFVMTGELILDLTAASNIVKLERLASKVTVEFNYYNVPDPHDSNITWVPQDKGKETRVYLSNAIATTTLGGPLSRDYITDSGSTWQDGTRDIFEYSYDYMSDLKGAVPYYYTYPIKMKEGDANQPYIKLVLPWYAYENSSLDENGTVKEGAAPIKQKEVYYKIALPIDDLKEGNRIYQYTADIRIVGADTEVEIDATYYVKNWLFGTPVSSKLATGRYISLDIPKNTYDMYSSLAEILFVSSGDVDVIINEISQVFLGGNTPATKYFMRNNAVTAGTETVTYRNAQGQNVTKTLLQYKGVTTSQIEGWVKVPTGTSILTINHEINDDVNSEAFDMSPYVFDVTLHLHGETSTKFDKRVVITQYPAMYVTSLRSNGYVLVNKTGYSGNNDQVNVYNDLTYGTNDQRRIGSIERRQNVTGSGTNNSQYNIIVHPTILDPSLNLDAGDARESTGSTMQYITGLTNYRPSRDDANTTVSPGFMIASSYGKTWDMPFDRAKERCASYQENGFPAGRWRIPTEGEIQFLVKLSRAGFIPSMFDGGYWASSGRYYSSTSNDFGTSTGNMYVRCIYDVWYWGETPMKADGTNATTRDQNTGMYTDAAQTWIGFKD